MRRWLKRIVIVFAVFGLPTAAFYFYVTWQGDRELRAVLEELDATEAPWRWDDLLAARAPVAAEDDGRALVLNVRSQMPAGFARKVNSNRALRPNLLLWPEEAELYSKEVTPLEAVLPEARKVAQMPKGRFHVRWTKDLLGSDLDDVQKAREIIYLLHIDAYRQAHHGDLEIAMEDCLAMQRISQALQDELGIMPHFARLAFQHIGLASLQRVLGHGQPSLEQLERLQHAWEQFNREQALVNAVRGQRAYSHRLFEAIAERKVAFQDATGLRANPWQAFINIYLRTSLKQSHAWTLRHWSAALESLELPEPERAARRRQLEDDARQAPAAAKFLMPAWVKIFQAHQGTETWTRCAIAALACERFRRTNERWPQSLAELSPKFLTKIPLDPCTGAPLLLRPTQDGIVIHSVGPDGKLRGAYYDEASPNPLHISYEFRLWNVNQRRLLDPRQ